MKPLKDDIVTSQVKYYKLSWPEFPIPEGEPCEFYYEVKLPDDIVLRIVEQMPNGDLIKNNLNREKKIWQKTTSLVEGSFLKAIEGMEFGLISKNSFEKMYSDAVFSEV